MDAITTVDELIQLTEQKLNLLRELRHNLDLAARAGVQPGEIDRYGYDYYKDERFAKWPRVYHKRIKLEPNYVILKDGRRIEVPIDWKAQLEALRNPESSK